MIFPTSLAIARVNLAAGDLTPAALDAIEEAYADDLHRVITAITEAINDLAASTDPDVAKLIRTASRNTEEAQQAVEKIAKWLAEMDPSYANLVHQAIGEADEESNQIVNWRHK